MKQVLIGCVGKPNAGKSSFLNASTDAKAKVGNYSFTTIDPNKGVAYVPIDCACKQVGKSELCKPRYGKCEDGTRYVPIQMLDVAGLIPGASEGLGLGNKFLDDLRTADVLLHVIDASGTTDAKGEPTSGYDPINDIEWLQEEICNWVFNNLWRKWGSIIRRHTATKSTALKTLQAQLSGYGTKPYIVQLLVDKMKISEPNDMKNWDEAMVKKVAKTFIEVRFPTVLVLNKCDKPGADKNIANICEKYGEDRVVPISALTECFLKKMKKQKYISYNCGDETFLTKADAALDPSLASLKSIDAKLQQQLDKIKDLVLYRFGGTGINDVLVKAIEQIDLIPVFPVNNINHFTSDNGCVDVFKDCILVRNNCTTVREVAHLFRPDIDQYYGFAEDSKGMKMGEGDMVTRENNIMKFTKSVLAEKAARDKKQKEKDNNKNQQTKKKQKEEET